GKSRKIVQRFILPQSKNKKTRARKKSKLNSLIPSACQGLQVQNHNHNILEID
ncbi:hypothetical protein LINPERHAP2_LOCUS7484, partial [Linum perenne]